MSLFIQHGWGKGNKIDSALSDNLVNGVILSPRDESLANMRNLVSQIQTNYLQASVLLDPQFYATTIPDARDGQLPTYPYYEPYLNSAAFTLSSIQNIVRATIDYQLEINLRQLLSPTISLNAFNDKWAQISLFLAQGCIDYISSIDNHPPLLISLVITEEILSPGGALDEFLNEITKFDVNGFYIIIQRPQGYTQRFLPRYLSTLMYIVYILSVVSKFKVIVGYTDFPGMLLRAAGATACATGWSQNLRKFSFDRFLPSQGGSAARPRYASLPLLNSILVSEINSCRDLGLQDQVLSRSPYDNRLFRNPPEWSQETSALHHWWVLSQIDSACSGNLRQRLAYCSSIIERAQETYSVLEGYDGLLDTASRSSHLTDWSTALSEFREMLRS